MGKDDISVATLLRHKAEKLLKSRPEQIHPHSTEGEILKLLHELEVYSVELELQNEELMVANKDVFEINKKNKFSDEVKMRLIHEFELNQIELEMQNEELMLTNAVSKDVADRYSDLFNFSASGYLILSNEGEIIDLNYSGARLLGKERISLKNSLFGFFVSDDSKQVFNNFIAEIFQNKQKISCEVSLSKAESKPVIALLTGILTQNKDQCLMTIQDITERKQITKYRDLTREILQILNEPGNIQDSIHRTLKEIKLKTGFDAVGIRLQEGNDFPYLDQSGFSTDFLITENTLIELNQKGKACRDKEGNVHLACTCGLVLSGKTESSVPFVSASGSWWTNDSSAILDIPASKDTRYHPRNQCILLGYESIALIPIRNKDKTVGLIQFNDYRKDVFNLNKIEFLEGIASHIGAALMRKQAEETLRRNEEFLRTITENAPDIIMQLDQQGTILYINRSFNGYSEEESLGKHFCDWTLPEYHDLMNRSLYIVFKEATTQTYLSKGNDIQGDTRWYRTSISPVKDGEKVKNAILITRDITESVLSEEILRESEDKRNAILNTAMDGFWISDRRGCFQEVNDTYCRMSGYSRQELLTMRIHDIEIYDHIEEVDARIAHIIELGEDRFETSHRRKDGSIMYIGVSIQYRKVNGGQFVTFLHDISKRKQREKVLFESNEHFRLLFENSSDAILFTNPDGTIYSINPEGEKMFGRCKEEIISLGRNIISDENDPRLINALEERREKGHFRGELNYLRKDGTSFPVDITSTIFKDSNGIERSSIIARDITERKKAEELLRINNLRLNLAMSVANMAWWEMNILTGKITFEKRKAEMLGYLPENFSHYRDFMKLVHPDDAEKAMEAMRQHIHGSADKYETEYRILTKTGDYKWFYDIGSVTTRDAKGKSIIVTGLVIDITDRKKAEELLRQSNERYKSLFQDNHSVMLLINPETGEIIDANPKACRYYGWSTTELCAKNISEINTLSNEDVIAEMQNAKLENRNHFFFRHRLASGEIRDVEVYSGPIQFGENTMLYSLVHDITDRKEAEKELQKSKDNLRAILDATLESIYLFDREGKVVDANITAAARLKRDLASLKDKKIPDFLTDGISEVRLSHLEEVFVTGKSVLFEDQRDEFIFEHNFFPVINNDKVDHVVSFSRDITQSRKVEQALRESEERVRFKLQSILSPEGNITDLELNDIIDAPSIQKLMDNFYDLVQVPMAIIDISGKVLVGVGWQDICTKFHRVHPETCNNCIESDVILTTGIPDGEFKLYKCKNNMWDIATPIIIGGEHKGNVFMGQFFFDNELVESDLFRDQANQYGFAEKDYLEALEKVPRLTKQKLDQAKAFFLNLSGSISQLSYSNIKLARAITQQNQAEEELRLTGSRLDAVFNGVTETIMMMDVDGIILDANQTALKRWSVDNEELKGKNWFELMLPEFRKERAAQILQMIETEATIRFEEDREGTIYDITFYPIKESGGKINQFVMFSGDITESKRAHEALLISEERYSAIFNSSRDGVFSMDLAGNLTGANRSFCRELELELPQIIGSTFTDIGLSENLSMELDHMIKEVSEKNDSINSEAKIQLPDGQVRYYETVFNPLHDNNENIVGFGGSIRNITKRKESNQALIESEKRFRHLIKDMPVGVILYGPKSEVITCNPKALELLGITKEQLIENIKLNPEWTMIHEDGSIFTMLDLPVVQVFKTHQSVHDVVIGICRKETTEITWLLKSAEIQLKEDGSVRNVVSSFIDITERKEKEVALRKLNQTLSALGKSSQAMSQPYEESEYLKKVCEIIVEDTDFPMVWVGYAEYDEAKTIRPVASAGFNDNYLESIKLSWDDNEFGCGPTGTAIRTGNIGICNNMLTDPKFEPWREQALKRGYASSIVFPLITGDFTFGALTIYSQKPDSFSDDEIKLLSKLASDLAHGITSIRLLAAHQIAEKALIKSHNELEQQVNERTNELLKLNDALVVTEEKYRTVADFATNWEFWIGPGDEMIYCSPSCERITGYTSTEFVINSMLIYDMIYPDDLKIYQEHREKEKSASKCDHEIQYRIFKKDGSIRWIGHFCRPVYDASGYFKGTRGSNKDITARKKMEELLTTSNQKYKLLSENITDGIFICKNGKFEYVNNAISDIFGYNGKELVGTKLTQLILTDYHEELENLLYSTSTHNRSCNIEVECLRSDFTVVFVEILLNYVAKDKTVYGVVHDITEKKEFQKNMVKAIIQTEEKERSHFSKELHDGLGPLLSTIKLYLQWSERPNSNKSREEIIGKAGEILEEALTTVKEISTKLSPHLLTNYGLSSAIKSFVEKLSATATYNIEFESNSTRRIDGDIETALYRAVIECINNTLKYAHATNIYIYLKDSGKQIQLQYQDDGKGFDIAETIAQHKGLGLFNLQNRLHTIGGKVDLKSEPGKGVEYMFTVNI